MKMLKVPYAEKDEVKALGARWNPQRKSWYVPDGADAAPFARWFGPQQPDGAPAPAFGAAAARSAGVDGYVGKPTLGAHFFELEHDCDPLQECAACRASLDAAGWSAARAEVGRLLSIK